MKIKNITKTQNQLIKLKLITTKIKKKINGIQLNLENIMFRLKKGLYIIYKFHITNKKLLFIGNKNLEKMKIKKLLNLTKHNFISEYI